MPISMRLVDLEPPYRITVARARMMPNNR